MEEEHEKKTMKIYGRRRPTSHIPLHLTSEILSRLTAKSVVRFRCVSKLWSSITTDSHFKNSFKTRSSTKPSLLLSFKKGDELFVFSIPQHCSKPSIDRYHMKFPKYDYSSITESVQGLISFEESGKLIVWNPSMAQFLTLPKPEMSWKKTKVFLGYDPIECKHKVVCMPQGEACNEIRVLTLGSPSAQESWRSIKTIHMEYPYFTPSSNGRCINGVLYYKVFLDYTNIDGPVIMRFDVKSEKFDTIELPLSKFWETLMTYEGKLACVERDDTVMDSIKLWILEDAEEKREWWSKEFHVPFVHFDQSLDTHFILKGIGDAGEFIYAPNGFYNSFCILFYDPERNSFRKVDFEGALNGVGNGSVNVLHTFTNHIETLMPL